MHLLNLMQVCADPEPLYELKGHRATVLSACFSPDNQNLVTGGLDSQLLFYRLNRSGHHFRLNGHTDAINSIDFATNIQTDQSFVLSGSRDKTVRLWKYNKILNRPEVDEQSPVVYHCGNTVRCVHSDAEGNNFCTGSDDKLIKIWSTQVPNKRITSLSGHTNWIKCCKFSATNSNLLASCGDDSSLRLFDLRLHERKGACLKIIETTRNRHFTYLDWFPKHSHFIAVASSNAMIRVYDVRNSASIVQFYAPHTDSVNCVTFHPSGAYLLTCSSDRSCKLIDVIEGRLLYTLRGHTKPLFACAFDSTGSHFVTAGGDPGVRLWKSNLPANPTPDRTSHSLRNEHFNTSNTSHESNVSNVSNMADDKNKTVPCNKFNQKLQMLDKHFSNALINKSVSTNSLVTCFNELTDDQWMGTRKASLSTESLATSHSRSRVTRTCQSTHRCDTNAHASQIKHARTNTMPKTPDVGGVVQMSDILHLQGMLSQLIQSINKFASGLTSMDARLTALENRMK